MDYRLIIALLLVLASAQSYGQAYRWVDENGVVHYSDRPQPGAEEIILPEAQSMQMVRRTPRPRESEPEEQKTGYDSISIASPAAEATLWNIEGNLTVTVALAPGLREGHQVRLFVDGRERMFDTTTIELTEIYRGAHNLQAEIINESSQVVARSDPIRFYVQQTSVLNPP